MDFLRRLAPARTPDPTRAVALLPARFAHADPLRTPLDDARSPPGLEEDGASSRAANFASAVTAGAALGLASATSVQRAPTAPRLPQRGSTRDENRSPTSSRDSITGVARSVIDAEPNAARNQSSVNSAHANSELPILAASYLVQGRQTLPVRACVAPPLSHAIQEVQPGQSPATDQVVHVTIGRIEVIAHNAPAPVVHARPAARQATVDLSDYLRGDQGSRR